jgi:hypothetical protein
VEGDAERRRSAVREGGRWGGGTFQCQGANSGGGGSSESERSFEQANQAKQARWSRTGHQDQGLQQMAAAAIHTRARGYESGGRTRFGPLRVVGEACVLRLANKLAGSEHKQTLWLTELDWDFGKGWW